MRLSRLLLDRIVHPCRRRHGLGSRPHLVRRFRQRRLFLESLEDRRVLTTLYTVNDSFSIAADATIVGNVLGNDYSDSGSYVWFDSISSPPNNGTLSMINDGIFTYTPNPGFVGTDSFYYIAATSFEEPGTGTSGDASVTIEIGLNPPPPTTVDDSYARSAGETLTVAAPGLLANDYDPEGRSPLRLIPPQPFLWSPVVEL